MIIAHTRNSEGLEHELKKHLLSTALIAASFGRNQDEKVLAKLAGSFHDAGKYQKKFQDYLRKGGKRGSVPHAAFGAVLSWRYSSDASMPLFSVCPQYCAQSGFKFVG